MDYKKVVIDSNGVGFEIYSHRIISYEFEILKLTLKMCIIVLKT